MYIRASLVVVILLLNALTVTYGQSSNTEESVVQILNSFHQAIVDNDSQLAQTLLSDSVHILEGGNVETKDEYLSHHFHSDGKFLSAINRKVDSQVVRTEGNIAWVSTKTHIWGAYNDRKLDLNSLELAVLQKVDGNWKIAALHWSSAQRN